MIVNFTKISVFLSLVITGIYADENGALLFGGNCATCHLQSRTLSAPSIFEIQTRYKSIFADKEAFVLWMSTWIAKPDAITSLMPEAVKKHGLMPELGYDTQALQDISAYIYENNFSKK